MELKVDKIPNSKTILIPVAEELIDSAAGIETIKHQDSVYKVFDFFIYKKGDSKPIALLYLALGSLKHIDLMFEKYKKSELIYLFVCNYERESKKKIEVEKEANKSQNIVPDLFD